MPGKANTINHKEENTGMEIKGKVHYVGVNDRNKTLFENLWPLPYGVSYNSYLIDDEMVALVDTVDVCYFEVYLKKIRSIIGDRPINYLIINHMEPDHSGSISLIKQYYPNIVIVGNKKTFDMVEGFYGVGGERYVVGEGDFLALGHHKLRFSLIPMVHWPETMVTYDETEGILFSGDAFGCFGALNGGVIDANINTDIYWDEMVRYYSNIVGKYGAPVQKALQKLQTLKINAICSTHGPVWTEEIPRVVRIYDRLSRYEAEEGVVIAYGTMYLTFILGKLAYRFGDALNDVCIAFADLFLKIEDLIIIHKLAEVGGKIQIVFLRRQIGAETERVLGREVAFKQINHPFEFFQLFHAAGDMVFQLLHQLCATLPGLPLFGHYYFGWAESGVFVKFGGLCQTFLQASLCFDALA